MKLASAKQYTEIWNEALEWYMNLYPHYINYQCIGTLAEFIANQKSLSLYNQNLKGE